MIIAVIVLSMLVLAETGFIFWLLKVLKNTFNIVDSALDMAAGKIPRNMKTAYDGKYYPATVISQIQFDSKDEMVITDFSMYEDKKIVGFTICTKESMRDYLGAAANDIPDEVLEETFGTPTIFKNVVVYAPREGTWTWKSQD
jgi:hypothetical protein